MFHTITMTWFKRKLAWCVPFLFLPISLHAHDATNMRGLRYCEVIVAHGFSAYVYNTVRLNDCPESLWNKLSIQEVKNQTDSRVVFLNGPRYFMIDGATDTNFVSDEIVTFGGLKMRKAGVLHLSPMDFIRGATPYRDHHVDRKTTWVYEAGKPVFELIDQNGRVFVMQSYSVEYEKQTQASLATLGQRLRLPNGWRFRTGVLKQEMELVAVDGKAVVIQDNFKNTYQLAATDFLDS